MNFVKKISKKYTSLMIIVLLGAVLRIWHLDRVPISLFGDEIDVGLHAYSILTTGKDYLGNTWPVFFRSFAEYRLPLQIYLSVPFVSLFGLNAWGVRLASALVGTVSLVTLFFLVKKLFNKKIALIATFLLAISPWHLQFSRQANDSGFLLPFIFLGILFFIEGTKSYKKFLFSAIFFALSFYSYAISAVFVPMLVVSLLVIYRENVVKLGLKKVLIAGAIAFLFLIPYIRSSFDNVATKRFSDISALNEDEAFKIVNEKRKISTNVLTRLFYNNRSVILDRVADNYLGSFSTLFLFIDGDPNPRHSINDFGMLYLFDLFLILIGIWVILRQFRNKKSSNMRSYTVILVWLIIAPIPASLTQGGATHAARLLTMLPPLILLSAIGLDTLIINMKIFYIKVVFVTILFFMIFGIAKFFHNYYVIWPTESWRFWNSGFKETISYVREHDSEFSRIYLNNTYEPMLSRFLFWYGYDMNLFQEQFQGDKHIEGLVPGFNGFTLGEKYYFGEFKKPVEQLLDENHLIVASAQRDITNPEIFAKPEIKLLNTIISPDGIPIFYVFTGAEEVFVEGI